MQSKSFVKLALCAMVVSGISFLIVLKSFPAATKSNELSAMGQWLGALFSCWGFIGLIFGQIFQYNSLKFQAEALSYQAQTLRDEIDANKLNNAASAISVVSSILETTRIALERIAESLIFSSPATSVPEIRRRVSESNDLNGMPYVSIILEDEFAYKAIVQASKYGVTNITARSYIDVYQRMAGHAETISKQYNIVDIFDISMNGSPARQLFLKLSENTTVDGDSG